MEVKAKGFINQRSKIKKCFFSKKPGPRRVLCIKVLAPTQVDVQMR